MQLQAAFTTFTLFLMAGLWRLLVKFALYLNADTVIETFLFFNLFYVDCERITYLFIHKNKNVMVFSVKLC